MDEQVQTGLTLFKQDVKIVYVNTKGLSYLFEPGCVILELEKLSTCPDVDMLLKALGKKISRVSIMKSQKYSSSLCIVLLASKGYCITSLELNNIPDTTVEVCWESLHNIYISVDEPLKSWLKDIIAERSYVDYGAQFCQRKFLSSSINTVGSMTSSEVNFKIVERKNSNIPDVIWDRDDAIYSALSSHFNHRI